MAKIENIMPYSRPYDRIEKPGTVAPAQPWRNWIGGSGSDEKENQSNHASVQQKAANAAQTAANAIARMKIPAVQQSNAQASGGGYGGGSGGNAPYVQQLNTLYDQIVNRKPFQYDVNADLLYRQMADQAMKNGALAARNAMGQAAALTGGYGNSYAEQVAAQAYQQDMTALNDNIPELYQQALNAYLAQGDQLLQQYELAAAHPGYLQALQPTGYGGGTRAGTDDYNSILKAMVNGIGSMSNAAAAEIAAKPIVSGGVNVAYPLAQGAYYDNLNKRFKK
jgi:hypothetical protein